MRLGYCCEQTDRRQPAVWQQAAGLTLLRSPRRPAPLRTQAAPPAGPSPGLHVIGQQGRQTGREAHFDARTTSSQRQVMDPLHTGSEMCRSAALRERRQPAGTHPGCAAPAPWRASPAAGEPRPGPCSGTCGTSTWRQAGTRSSHLRCNTGEARGLPAASNSSSCAFCAGEEAAEGGCRGCRDVQPLSKASLTSWP